MKAERGFSLIEVMVVTGILSVTLTVVASVFSSQQRLTSQLADKLASLDLARTLSGTLAGGNVCTFMIGNAPPYTFDPSNMAGVNVPPFAQIPSRPQAGAMPALVADGVIAASPNSTRLVATSIRIANVNCAVQPCTPTSNSFNADLLVTFDSTKTTAPIAPLAFPIVLSTTPGAGGQTLSTCTYTVGAAVPGTIDRTMIESVAQSCIGAASSPACLPVPVPVFATCPAGYEVSGCGYRLTAWPGPYPAGLSGDATPGNDYLNNSPALMVVEGNTCRVEAGQPPGCGACFVAQAMCIRIQ